LSLFYGDARENVHKPNVNALCQFVMAGDVDNDATRLKVQASDGNQWGTLIL